jgi:uncharacterized membrane protein YhaH (DUF805 family)
MAERHYRVGAWITERIVIAIFIGLLALLVCLRRLQNAGLSRWLTILAIPPIISTIFWLTLLLVPTKTKISTTAPIRQNQ